LADRIPARLTAAEGRKFAFTVGAAFLVLAAITWWRDHPTLLRVFGGLGAALFVLGAVVPASLGPVQRGWMALAHAISKVTTPIFMGIVYFVVITPTGLLMKAFGKAPLRAPRGAPTYWTTRAPEKRRSDLSRQF
jgi:hypothetical protein